MQSFFYYIAAYLFLGALGMFVANKRVTAVTKRERWLKYFSYTVIMAIVVAAIFARVFRWLACLLVLCGFAEICLIDNRNKTKSILPIFVYGLIAGLFLFFSFRERPAVLLFVYFQVLIFDAFCQLTGQIIGKRLLVPGISPSKTIEGLAGGWTFCVLSAVLGANWVSLATGTAAILGFVTGACSLTGDLLASKYKRLVGIKDYSNWLPGQGGFLDRFDSLMFCGAVYSIIETFEPGIFAIKI